MFGYVKVQRAELRVREYEYYRASYCGLCRSMGKCTGQCSRLSLSYDIAFLAEVRMALANTTSTFKKRRCIAHPLRRRVMMEPNAELSYAADVSALLAYEKCRDDRMDSKGFSKIKAALQCLFLRGAYRRARKRHPALAALFRERLAALSALEKERLASVDAPAAIFGEMLSAAFAEGLAGAKARLAATVGEKIGRFIYIIDAVDDAPRDAKTGNYNPVLLLYGGVPSEAEKENIYHALLASLDDMSNAFDLMLDAAYSERSEVLQNILYLGLPAVARRVLFGTENEKKESDGGAESI